jgi:hypothetical protein
MKFVYEKGIVFPATSKNTEDRSETTHENVQDINQRENRLRPFCNSRVRFIKSESVIVDC